MLFLFVCEQRGALIEELSRVSAENKKLTELLTIMCENYTELRNQLTEYTNKNLGVENDNGAASRKRKADNVNGNLIDATNVNPSESSSSDDDSLKKHREEHNKAKISRIHVRTEASDTSLVSLATINRRLGEFHGFHVMILEKKKGWNKGKFLYWKVLVAFT